jgi:hypothetical protein
MYLLSTPYLFALYCLGCYGKTVEAFGYLWLSQEDLQLVKSCSYFEQASGWCEAKGKRCFILYNKGAV